MKKNIVPWSDAFEKGSLKHLSKFLCFWLLRDLNMLINAVNL